MQFLGHAFEHELARRGRVLNVLGATSGDTGSAAEHALRGKRGIAVFMLSPHGRMSPFQQAQMFSLHEANIHNLSIDGVFDDCQDLVKAVSSDLEFKRRWSIGAVNSINWARLAAQVVYYFAGYFQATKNDDERRALRLRRARRRRRAHPRAVRADRGGPLVRADAGRARPRRRVRLRQRAQRRRGPHRLLHGQ